MEKASEVPKDAQLTADLCIVGAGAAGLSIAHRLLHSGLRIILLESDDQPQSCRSTPPGSSDLYRGEQGSFLACIYDRGDWLVESRKRTYGGSTNCWGSTCHPLAPIDFEARDAVPGGGWPFGIEELMPWYGEAQEIARLAELAAYDVRYWVERGYADPFAAHPAGFRTVIAQQAPAEYNKFQCLYGPEIVESEEVDVYLGANLVGIDTDASGSSVTAFKVAAKTGERFSVCARRYVLAAGGIESVRLLFNADPARFPAGLGNNRNDLLGRFFMVHPLLEAAAYAPQAHFDGIFAQGPPPQGPYRTSIQPWVAPTRDLLLARGLANFRLFLANVGGRTAVNLNWQQVANPASRMVPIAATDRLEQRRIRLDWQLLPQDRATASTALDALAELLAELHPGWRLTDRFDQRSGRCDGWEPHRGYGVGLSAGEHHMGTTRMAADPDEGIVDPSCRVHAVDNLYVASSSVFPSVGYSNPTLTIIALALRLAEHLRSGLGG